MEKLTIVKVSYTDKKKTGEQIKNKWGKVVWRVGLQTEEYGNQWINGFLPFAPDKWEGTKQELEITREQYNGQEQLRFALPNREAQRDAKIAALQETVFNLEKRIFALEHGMEKPKQEEQDFPDEPSEEELSKVFA